LLFKNYSITYISNSLNVHDVQSGAPSPNDVVRSSGGSETN